MIMALCQRSIVINPRTERHGSPIFLRVFDVFDGLGQRLASFLRHLRPLQPPQQGFAGSLLASFTEYGGGLFPFYRA